MDKQTTAYIEQHLSPYLCGYRKGYSCQHALLSMIEKWKMSRDQGGHAGGILMDLSKAFDTINHELLIAKLHAYGFSHGALEIVYNYLKDRWQRTKINTAFSTRSKILCGVPQGSVPNGPSLRNGSDRASGSETASLLVLRRLRRIDQSATGSERASPY